MFWFTLLVWAVTTVAYELIRPKPKFENARPAGLGDFQFPTATEGRAIPLVWGKVKITGPNVVWYGNFQKEAQTEDVNTGMFSSETVTTHYKYYVGMQFALCHGEVDAITRVWINEKPVSVGTISVDGNTLGISNPTLFGGEEHGSGGVEGTLRGYLGTKTQAVNSYIDAQISGDVPAYRGTCYAVYEGGWIGNSTNVAPWAFEVERYPDGLNMATEDPGAEQPNAGDCNPMNVLYEILTDDVWGLNIDSSFIDTANFQEAASTLAEEGNGFSMFLDRATEISSLIDEIQRQIDGSLYFDRAQGQWRVKLARDDYTVGTLTTLNESNILELKEFTRQTWEETSNQMRVAYIDRSDEYKNTFAVAQDSANIDIQGQSVQSDATYPGVKVAALANAIAWRDLKAASYPLAKVKFTMNRGGWQLAPGSVFKFSWDSLGLNELVMRVGKINYGKPGESKIEVFAIQDIFASSAGVYGDPSGTGWEEPTDDPAFAAAGDSVIFEAPRQLIRQDPYSEYQHPRLWFSCRYPGDGTTNMKAYIDDNATGYGDGSFVADASVYGFVVTGELNADLDAYGTTPIRPDTSYTITIDNVDDLSGLAIDGDDGLVNQLGTVVYIDGEFIGYEKLEDLGGGQVRLSRIHRGLMSSAPKGHSATATVWFLSQGGSLSREYINSANVYTRTQLRGVNGVGDETTEAATPDLDYLLENIYLAPLPPRDPYLNTVYADETNVSIDTDWSTETSQTGEDGKGIELEFTPRDWREDVLTEDDTLGAAWADDDPEFDTTVTIDPGGGDYQFTVNLDDQSTTPTVYLLRNEFIKAVGSGTIMPTTAKIEVLAKHFVNIAHDAPETMDHEFTITSALTSYDIAIGAFYGGSDAFVVGETGTYNFTIETALPSSGLVQANVNGGGFVTVIGAASTTGGISLTSGDSVVLRATQSPTYDQFLDVAGPTSETAYGVITA